MSKSTKQTKKEPGTSSSFAADVVRVAATKRFIWDYLEQDFLKSPATQEMLAVAEKLNWPEDAVVQMRLSQTAVRMDSEQNSGLADVFEMCGLDPAKPLHWRALLDALVEVGFKEAGAPPEWDLLSYYHLVGDIDELRVKRPGLRTHVEIAKGLRSVKPFEQKYRGFKVDNLRKRVSEAQKMGPATSLADFVERQSGGKYKLPDGYVGAYVRRAVAAAVAREGFDADASDAVVDKVAELIGQPIPRERRT